jgi:GNAT superfamily N-acetyltransferase
LPGATGPDSAIYVEPARSYLSSALLFALLGIGFVVDLALGGAAVHGLAWAAAAVVVVGFDAGAVRSARRLRSITVTAGEVRVGSSALARPAIVGVTNEIDPRWPVLGRQPGEGLPRRTRGLGLVLDEGAVLVPTRHPLRLAAVLGRSFAVPEVRPAAVDDLAALPEVQQRAGVLFELAGLALPPHEVSVDEFHQAHAVFVAGRPPVGFARVVVLDGLAHLDQISVVPGRMRQGLGSALVEAACAWAHGQGYPAITLITFAEVSFNGPFYAARGFVEIDEITPELAELRDWERDAGLDAVGRRIVMRRELAAVDRGELSAPRPANSPRSS